MGVAFPMRPPTHSLLHLLSEATVVSKEVHLGTGVARGHRRPAARYCQEHMEPRTHPRGDYFSAYA